MNNPCYFCIKCSSYEIIIIYLYRRRNRKRASLLTYHCHSAPDRDGFPMGDFCRQLPGLHTDRCFYTLTSRIHITNELRLLLTIGLCGGFTTFSTFSNESLQLLKSGFYPTFFAYVIGSVVLGIIGVMLGVWMSE